MESTTDQNDVLIGAIGPLKPNRQVDLLFETSAPVAEIHWQLGLLYEKTGRYKQAADELESFLKAAPKNANTEQVKKLIENLRSKSK